MINKEIVKNLKFDNSWVNKEAPYISISEVNGLISKPFDSDAIAQKTYDKNFNNPESKYYQMSVEDIKESWAAKGAESCRYGSLLDDFIGYNLTGTSSDVDMFKLDNAYDYDERLKGLCNSFDHFYENYVAAHGNIKFIAREQTVYLKVKNNDGSEFYVKGRFDAMFYDEMTNKIIIVDWKSSGSIDTTPNRWTGKLLGPMYKFPELNHYTYTNQLYFYKTALIYSPYLVDDQGNKIQVDPDDIVVIIVNLPGKTIEHVGLDWQIYQAAYPYDPRLCGDVYKFGFNKKQLMNKSK